MKILNILVIAVCLSACHSSRSSQAQSTTTTTDSVRLFDQARNRAVPVMLYYSSKPDKQKPAIFSHGYGMPNTAYSAFANSMAENGYVVASIQHDLPGDAAIPSTGNIYEVRMPFWQRGAENILFVINTLKEKWPSLQYDSLVLIGHSNGGDMSMLFAQQHPQLVAKVISLDNRRMPFPRTSHPRIFSLRSSDQPADEGVLPNGNEQLDNDMIIIKLPNTAHNQMNDSGTEEQKQQIIQYLLKFLKS